MINRIRIYLFLLVISSIAMYACGSAAIPVTPTVTLVPSPSLIPTATATPSPAYLIFVAPTSADAAFVESLQNFLKTVAQDQGLVLDVRQNLSQSDFEDQAIKIVLALSPELDLAHLAQAVPQTQFVFIGSADLAPQPNLSIIETQPPRPDWEGFLAGFIAATVTPEWRVGVVADNSSIEGKAAQNGFANGVKFMCGLCQPIYPPFPIPTYPLALSLNAASPQADIDAGIATFQEWGVKTVYLYHPTAELLTAFGAGGFNLMSDQAPPENLKGQWIATLQGGDALQELQTLLPALLSGKGGQVLNAELTPTNINEDLFSPGKQEFVNDLLQQLLAGQIDSGVDSTTGELKK
ncbi:MAG: hypothetical protein ACPL3P_01690 [Anaerolineales bacterium]